LSLCLIIGLYYYVESTTNSQHTRLNTFKEHLRQHPKRQVFIKWESQ